MVVSFIIPVFGQWQLTKNCLLSLKIAVKIPFEVILIDNGYNILNDDATRHEAPILGKKLFNENFVYLPQEKNLNFAGGSNLGAKTAKAPLLFFLNNDTVVDEHFLMPLLEEMQKDAQMKLVAPVLQYPDGHIQHIGVYFTPYRAVAHLYEGFPANHRVVKRKRSLQCITAAAFLIKKSDFFEAGAFNEEFINGFEDVEFCGRIQKYNPHLQVIPQSLVTHYCSQSQGRFDKESHNSQVLTNSGSANFSPDWHIFLANDGFELRYGEHRRFYPEFNAKMNAGYDHLIKENNLEKMLDAYNKEKYWKNGFYAIINHPQINTELKFNIILHSYYRRMSLELLYYLFQNSTRDEQRKFFANEIDQYLFYAKNERIPKLIEDAKTIGNLTPTLVQDCKHALEITPLFLERLKQFEVNALPHVAKYID